MEKIKWVANRMPKTGDLSLPVMSLENVKKARAFHKSFPQYAETPLAKLDGMAKELGLKKLFVKDESYRFGLNAFKVLGGSFAMANYIAEAVGKDVSECDYAYLTSEKLREEFGQATFFTATDGNHGRGVAWAANKLGQKAVVLMPKGSTKTRFDNIAKEGAKVTIEEVNYDECVRRANALDVYKRQAVGRVIAVVSGKGGVGKSLVTSLLACEMQRRGHRTAVLDADITGPSIPQMFGVHEGARGGENLILHVVSRGGMQMMSMNVLLPKETDPVVWRGPVIAGAVEQFWTDVIWDNVD